MVKKLLLWILTAAVLSTIGTGIIQAMTKPIAVTEPKTTLHIEEGMAHIRSSETDIWRIAKEGETLNVGDSIKTQLKTTAFINFFDYSSTRLDEDTQITLTRLYLEKNFITSNVKFELDFGRIWTRIINILDAESSFEIIAEDTVATILGTAISAEVPKNKDQNPLFSKKISISVNEGLINVANSKSTEKTKIKAGEKVIVKTESGTEPPNAGELPEEQKGTPEEANTIEPLLHAQKIEKSGIEIIKINNVEATSNWFTDNKKKDDAYLAEIQAKKGKEIKKQSGFLPGNPLYKIKQLSEKIVLATTLDKDKKLEKKKDFIQKRSLEAAVLLNKGKKILAIKALNEFNEENIKLFEEISNLNNEGKKEEAEKTQFHLTRIVSAPRHLLRTTLPDTAEFKAREQIQKTIIATAPTPEFKREKEDEIKNINKKSLKLLLVQQKYEEAEEYFKEIKDKISDQEAADIIDEIPVTKIQDLDQLRKIKFAQIEKLELKFEEKFPISTREDVEKLTDGSFKETLPDGTVRIVRPNGEIQKTLPDKTRQIISKNGKMKQINIDGTVIERWETEKTSIEKTTDNKGKITEKTTLKRNAIREKESYEAEKIKSQTIEETDEGKTEKKILKDDSIVEITENKKDEIIIETKKDKQGKVIETKNITEENKTQTKDELEKILEDQESKRQEIIDDFLEQLQKDTTLNKFIIEKYGTKQTLLEEIRSIKNIGLLQKTINEYNELSQSKDSNDKLTRDAVIQQFTNTLNEDEEVKSFLEDKELTVEIIIQELNEITTTKDVKKFISDFLYTIKKINTLKSTETEKSSRSEIINKLKQAYDADKFFKDVIDTKFESWINFRDKMHQTGTTEKINEIYLLLKEETKKLQERQETAEGEKIE